MQTSEHSALHRVVSSSSPILKLDSKFIVDVLLEYVLLRCIIFARDVVYFCTELNFQLFRWVYILIPARAGIPLVDLRFCENQNSSEFWLENLLFTNSSPSYVFTLPKKWEVEHQ